MLRRPDSARVTPRLLRVQNALLHRIADVGLSIAAAAAERGMEIERNLAESRDTDERGAA